MRALPALLFSASLLTAHAQPIPPLDGPPPETPLERLFSERESKEKFDEAVAAAKKAGATDQAVLEGKFLFNVDQHEDEAIAALLPEFEKQSAAFNLEESEIFSTVEDWLAVFEYVKAIAALKDGDKDAFKKHITEAFWLSPRQGAAFAPHIDRLRLEEAMGAVRIDFSQKYPQLLPGDPPIPLSEQIAGKKALLLHFWSPWSRECEESMPDFIITAAELLKNDIAVASVLPENSTDAQIEARELVKQLGDKALGGWLVDKKQGSLNRLLRVQSVPNFVLISSDGGVLFNGHPADSTLWESLAKVNPSIVRPDAADDHDHGPGEDHDHDHE